MADGPDIFGIDKPKSTDPWAEVQAQRARLAPKVADPKSDVDSKADFAKRAAMGDLTPKERAEWNAAKRREAEISRNAEARSKIGPSVAETSISGGAASRQRAMGLAGQLDAGYAVRSKDNPMYPHVQDYVGEKRRIMGEQPQVLDQRQAAERQAAADLQAHTDEVAARTRDARIDTQAKAFVQAEEVAAALEARRSAQTAAKEATDSFQRAQEINPDGFWQTRTKGMKARALIGNLIAGFGGQSIIPDLQNAAREHTEAAKANLAKREKLVGMREGEARDAAEIYQLTLQKVGDARAADLILERAWMADAAAQWDRLAAQAGARMLAPEQQAQRLALDEAIANMDLQIDQLAATNVKAFRQRVDLLGSETRRAARKQIDADIKMGADLTTGAVDQAGKLEIEQAKAQAGGDEDGLKAQQRFDQRKWVAEKTAPFQAEARLLKEIQTQYSNEVPGFVRGVGWVPERLMTDAGLRAKERFKRAAVMKLRRESGANTPETELEREAGLLIEKATDEDDLMGAIEDRLAEAEAQIDFFERAPEESEVEQVRRSKVAPRTPMAGGGFGADDPVQWEE